MTTDKKTETEALAGILKESCDIEVIQAQESHFAVVPKDRELKSLKPFVDEYLEKPRNRAGQANVDRLQSFIDLTNRFKDESSALFGKGKIDGVSITASLTSILDYNRATPDNKDARFGKHRVFYNFPVAKEFLKWIENNGKPLGQIEFASFLEDNIGDLCCANESDAETLARLNPNFAAPVNILELSRGLEIRSQESVKKFVKLQSGETEMQFTAQHTDGVGNAMIIPNFFMLDIPVFEGDDFHRIPVRLRYRVTQGSVLWAYDIYRPQDIFDTAFDSACKRAAVETGLPLYMGTPEAA